MRHSDNIETIIRAKVLAAAAPTVFVAGAVLTGLIKPIFKPPEDPLDVGTDKSKWLVAEAAVTDEQNNGFRVVYATSHDVTAARAAEIRSRQHIRDSLERLKIEAPRHFGSMLRVDIYDFTEYALRFAPDSDIYLHNVFVHGREKMNLYIGPNPAIENPAKWISSRTLQGILYINREDILYHRSDSLRVYRYWRCRPPFNWSDTDEHWSHFSEDERQY